MGRLSVGGSTVTTSRTHSGLYDGWACPHAAQPGMEMPCDTRAVTLVRMKVPKKHPCPCCGYRVLEEPGAYEICPICGWEDDVSQLRFATMPGGANRPSLR